MIAALRTMIKRMHYPLEVMLTCVRWYVSYLLSFRHLEEMVEKCGVVVDHATIHRWAIKIVPVRPLCFADASGHWARVGAWTRVCRSKGLGSKVSFVSVADVGTRNKPPA